MTASEQRLALGLGAVVVLGGAFLGITKLRSWKQAVDVSSLEMQSRKFEADDLMGQKDFWQQRFGWLAEKQPLFTQRGEIDNLFLDVLQSSADEHGVNLEQIQPREPSERNGIISSTFSIVASADWTTLNRWLHDLQKPDAFISIPLITMSVKEDDTSMVVVSMNIQKWFRLDPL